MTPADTLTREFSAFGRSHRLFSANDNILVAVSGGVDSMVLLDLLLRLRNEWHFGISVLHVNHQLRGDESMEDEDFVRHTAAHLQLPFYCERLDTMELKHRLGVSKQVAAREGRYEIFERIRKETSSNRVATAHHADDNAETVLLNALRGTGIRGLSGIPVTRDSGRIIRPLLFARRKEIVAYATERGIAFQNDSSNDSTVYTRNYLRHAIVPLLSEVVETDIVDSLNRISHATSELRLLLDRLVDEHLPQLAKFQENGCEVALVSFSDEPTFMKEEIILRILRHLHIGPTQRKVNEILELCTKQSGHSLNLSAGILVHKMHDRLVFSERMEPSSFSIPVSPGDSYASESFTFSVGKPGPVPSAYAYDGLTEYVDADKIERPLTLRPWRAGDWFVPLGMNGKKKLSDFFNDEKVPHLEKVRTPVLTSATDIIWVCGRRIDNRYRITDTTRRAIRLSYSPTVQPVH